MNLLLSIIIWPFKFILNAAIEGIHKGIVKVFIGLTVTFIIFYIFNGKI